MKKILFLFILFLILFNLEARFVFASEISIKSDKSEANIGEQFIVDVVVNSNETLNAIEGSMIYPENSLKVDNIIFNNSVINFWVEKPKVENGKISFSGVTPVGFSGVESDIFSVVFTADKPGPAEIYFENSKGYLSDGKGTVVYLKIIPSKVYVEDDVQNTKEDIVDTEPPEDFTPVIVSDQNLNNGKKTLIFYTQDKKTDVKEYLIKEGYFGFYKKSKSPYLLKDQTLTKDIYIKAVDYNGNSRIVILPKSNNTSKVYYNYLVFLLVSTFVVLWLKLRKH